MFGFLSFIAASVVLFIIAPTDGQSLVTYGFAAVFNNAKQYPDVWKPSGLAVGTSWSDVNVTKFSKAPLPAGGGTDNEVHFFTSGTNQPDALTKEQYFSFTVTPDAGFAVNISQLIVSHRTNGGTSPRRAFLRTSADEFANTVVDFAFPNQLAYAKTVVPLGVVSANAVTFRIYLYADTPTSALILDSVMVDGVVFAPPSPVPSPTSSSPSPSPSPSPDACAANPLSVSPRRTPIDPGCPQNVLMAELANYECTVDPLCNRLVCQQFISSEKMSAVLARCTGN